MAQLIARVLDVWRFHRRAALVTGGGLLCLLALLVGTAIVVRESRGAAPQVARNARATTSPTTTAPAAPATDVTDWDAIEPVQPATSAAYPAIGTAARRDPSSYARAFTTELFTRHYANDRRQLLAWAQYEDSPLRSPNYPPADWTKVLVDSLTDLTWDDAIETPIPADGLWLALRSQRGTQEVTDIRVSLDQQWEQLTAGGYQPPDPLATARDVSATVVQHTVVSGHTRTARFQISLALQLGTSPHGGYGVAATNNYVVKEVG